MKYIPLVQGFKVTVGVNLETLRMQSAFFTIISPFLKNHLLTIN